MRRTLVAALLVLAAAESGAQVIPRGIRLSRPSAWASLGAGYLYNFRVNDGATGSVWNFGDATQFGASLEHDALGGAATIGVRGTTASVPLRYSTTLGDREADARVSQLFGTVHVSGSQPVHSVLAVDVGATMYSSFRERGTGAAIGPPQTDVDFSFGFGYGIGFALSPRFSLDIVQTQTYTRHQDTGLVAGTNTSPRMSSTRVLARFGLGG